MAKASKKLDRAHTPVENADKGIARATGGPGREFRPGFDTRINASKDYNGIQQQMDRILVKMAQRMGIPDAENRVMFRFADEGFNVTGGSGYPNGEIFVDSGVLNPFSLLRAPEFSRLSLRSRIQVILVHEAEEIPLLQRLGDAGLSHALTIREAAPTSPLRISGAAMTYLARWGELGPFEGGIR